MAADKGKQFADGRSWDSRRNSGELSGEKLQEYLTEASFSSRSSSSSAESLLLEKAWISSSWCEDENSLSLYTHPEL
jgi:hypothetical protein